MLRTYTILYRFGHVLGTDYGQTWAKTLLKTQRPLLKYRRITKMTFLGVPGGVREFSFGCLFVFCHQGEPKL